MTLMPVFCPLASHAVYISPSCQSSTDADPERKALPMTSKSEDISSECKGIWAEHKGISALCKVICAERKGTSADCKVTCADCKGTSADRKATCADCKETSADRKATCAKCKGTLRGYRCRSSPVHITRSGPALRISICVAET